MVHMAFGPLKIRLYGDPCLETKSKPVKVVGPVERMLIAAMFETMIACRGVGLAAPQVGINEQIFVVDTGKEIFAAINPRVIKAAGQEVMEEGCLSIPGFREPVSRANKVTVKAYNEKGEPIELSGEELLARAFQHEIDHLNGKLFINHLSALKRDIIRRKIKKLQKAGEWD